MPFKQMIDISYNNNLNQRRNIMDTNTLKGNWHILKGKIKQQWGELTDDDLTKIEGDAEELIGILQKRYSYTYEKAKQEVEKFQ